MKKLLSLLLACAMFLSLLTGCGEKSPENTTTPPTQTIAPTETTTQTETSAPTETDAPGSDGVPISVVRGAEDGASVLTTGVVAKITYSYGMVPSGFILVDGTDSIYVYGSEVASQVEEGNTITIGGTKTHWILEDEQANAAKFGYHGCCQIVDAVIERNDNGNSDFPKENIPETTVKAIMDTPVTEDITTQIYKVTALVKKVEGNGFTNYYINDLDGTTGSYVYTQCSGGDFAWLDEFDGKICTVYLTALNAKSSSSGCFWRFLPVAVVDENFDVSTVDPAKFAVEYHGLPQFQAEYTGDPALDLITSVDSQLLNFIGASLTYASDNESVISFTDSVMHCNAPGTANVTVTGSHGDKTYSKTITITVSENATIEYITVTDAIAANVGDTVTVKGIVGPSLVNRSGFYLIDGEALIAVTTDEATLQALTIGDEVILNGKRDRFHDGSGSHAGQTAVTNCTVVANYYGDHDYSTDFFVADKTLADFYNLDASVDYSTTVFVLNATVDVVETPYYTKIQLNDGGTTVSLYCASANQYSFLKDYAGQEVTVELAACNWNDKSFWAGCVLAVRLPDCTKVVNSLNFG